MVMRVGYLGPRGSYSHQAVLQLFPLDSVPPVAYVALSQIPNLLTAIKSNDVDASVVPYENSTNGRVPATVRAVTAYYDSSPSVNTSDQLSIRAETKVRVNHCIAMRRRTQQSPLLGNESRLREIKSLHTHSQAWGQCSKILNADFCDVTLVRRINEGSTSQAAELVSHDDSYTQASISSVLAADLYGLEILAKNIQDDSSNITRFLLMTKPGTELNPRPVASTKLDDLPLPQDARRYLKQENSFRDEA
jgi:prephenate dehydratase